MKDFFERRFPPGTKIKIEASVNEELAGRICTINSIDDDCFMSCTDDSGTVFKLDALESRFYKPDGRRLESECVEGTFKFSNVKEVAEFIIKYGLYEDLAFYDSKTGEEVFWTKGVFLDHIEDMDYRTELLNILIPMQKSLF